MNPIDDKAWKRSWAFAYEEQEDLPDGALRAGILTGRFSPYCMRDGEHIHGPTLVPLDETLDWCRQQAARVELWIGDVGNFSAGELKVPRRPVWRGDPKTLRRRRPRGFEWLDRTSDDGPIAWMVRTNVWAQEPLSADARRTAARAAVAAVGAVPEASDVIWSTDPEDSDGFRLRALYLAPTSAAAGAAVVAAVESVLPPPLRCSSADAQPARS